ncbi:MAG: protein tyrosine phosphatase family protein [Nitrosomonas sp.]|nr:MAG: protein tyrosine phosphatase family protein [Nitrosomonas sp.]
MKHFIILTALVTIVISSTAHATGRVPFGHQVVAVQNYSRITEQIALSGLISDGGVPALAATGIKTVIDLRTKNEGTAEERSLVDGAGMIYVNIPTTVAGITKEQLAEFAKVMESVQRPLLIHCGSGNRASAMWASYQITKGMDPEAALENARKTGLRPPLEEKIREAIADNSLCVNC